MGTWGGKGDHQYILGSEMILLQSHCRFLLQNLLNRVQNLEKGVELDYHWVEFDDIRYDIQAFSLGQSCICLRNSASCSVEAIIKSTFFENPCFGHGRACGSCPEKSFLVIPQVPVSLTGFKGKRVLR